MSTVDHTAEAQKHYEEAIEANQNGHWETTRFEMQLAKFHTESAALEQQKRIADELHTANLLAYGEGFASTLDAQGATVATHAKEHALVETLGSLLRDRLGLNQ